MKDELRSPAFAPKAFGAVTTVMPCLSRQSLATAESNPHQSGSQQIKANHSDFLATLTLMPARLVNQETRNRVLGCFSTDQPEPAACQRVPTEMRLQK